MPTPTSSLESQISTLKNELQLSTFLNKGILQTNTEHTLRIAELEHENEVLRSAERRLASTEDVLEDVERHVKELERERRDWRVTLREIEKERDEWKARCERLTRTWEASVGMMGEALAMPFSNGHVPDDSLRLPVAISTLATPGMLVRANGKGAMIQSVSLHHPSLWRRRGDLTSASPTSHPIDKEKAHQGDYIGQATSSHTLAHASSNNAPR